MGNSNTDNKQPAGQLAGFNPELGSTEYFLNEVGRLRMMWGVKTFWESKEQAIKAFEGLAYVYFNTSDLESVDGIFESTRSEFETRLSFA